MADAKSDRFFQPPQNDSMKCLLGESSVKRETARSPYHGESGRSEEHTDFMLFPPLQNFNPWSRNYLSDRHGLRVSADDIPENGSRAARAATDRICETSSERGSGKRKASAWRNHGVRQLSGQRAGNRSGAEAYVPVVNHPADAINANAVKMPSVAMSA